MKQEFSKFNRLLINIDCHQACIGIIAVGSYGNLMAIGLPLTYSTPSSFIEENYPVIGAFLWQREVFFLN